MGQSTDQVMQGRKDPHGASSTSFTESPGIPGAFEYLDKKQYIKKQRKNVINCNGKHVSILSPEGITILFYEPRQIERRDGQEKEKKKRVEGTKKTNFNFPSYF